MRLLSKNAPTKWLLSNKHRLRVHSCTLYLSFTIKGDNASEKTICDILFWIYLLKSLRLNAGVLSAPQLHVCPIDKV